MAERYHFFRFLSSIFSFHDNGLCPCYLLVGKEDPASNFPATSFRYWRMGRCWGTGLFALAASDTVSGFSMFQRKIMIVYILAGKASGGPGNIVVQGKILRDGDLFWTSVGAVRTSGTGNRRIFLDDLLHLIDDFLFFL